MKADAYDLSKVFGYDRQLFAPLFQRPYVWEKEKQWRPLWEDTKIIAEKLLEDENSLKPHFLGAVVLEQFRVSVGKPDARSIIDGQQRLTTIQIFLAALRDVCIGNENLEKLSKAVERLIFNDESMIDEDVDRYKVWPTNMDQPAYVIVMTTQSPSEVRAELIKHDGADRSNIADAYFYFYETIKNWALDSGELSKDRLQALKNTIMKGLRLVVVDMDEEDNAQLIFETLNARGTPLLPTDLVKNFLFHRARKDRMDVQALYDSYWHQFDFNHRFWREEITQGRLKRPRIDLLLQHYLTLQKEDDVVARSLFLEFQLVTTQKEDKDSKWFLESLKKHGDFFKHFLTVSQDTREGIFFYRLKVLDTTTVFPFLLGLYESIEEAGIPQEEKVAILIAIESYLVRRMVCRLSAKNYNHFFLELLKETIRNGQYTVKAIKSFLSKQTADTSRWPSDKEFKDAWLSVPLYHAITRPRLRMILMALDNGLKDVKTEAYTLKEHLTVEHLMPQLWRDHWPLPAIEGEAFEEKSLRIEYRNQLIQTIGNLFYLTNSLNPYVSNGPFEKKKAAILEHSAININRKFLTDTVKWDEAGITKRSEELFGVAVSIWPGPDEKIQAEGLKAVESPHEVKDDSDDKSGIFFEWDEIKFFDNVLNELGEDSNNALRDFYNMLKASPYQIKWNGEENNGHFGIHYPQLAAGSIIDVNTDGSLNINFMNIRGSENAELYCLALGDDLANKFEIDVSEGFETKTIKLVSEKWLNRSDTLMDILDSLLEELIDIEDNP